ncbi:Pectin lyase fold/virulence factor [Ceraceosorus bombacis]|uniref:pectinesterase n=1 Tax=Ceraceosorus bombacis TaxID=401625 RepID=A0A0P1BJZ6_9BASI|nr:Pectin lyase fold/virulence factor [Ceraceosorus bombacis]
MSKGVQMKDPREASPRPVLLGRCQRSAAQGLEGCPKNTIYVQSADELASALAGDSTVVILKSGVKYRGRFRAKRSLVLAGELEVGAVPVLATFACGNVESDGTSTLVIEGENTNVLVKDVQIQNECDDNYQRGRDPPDFSYGSSPALWVATGSSASIMDTQLYSWRSTLAVHGRANVFRSEVQGWYDWIWGTGRLFISDSQIAPRGKGNIVTWDSSVSNGAVVIKGSTVGPAADPFARKDLVAGSVYLARPWISDTTSIWISTKLFDIVNPALWSAQGYRGSFVDKQRGVFGSKSLSGQGYVAAKVDKKLDSSDTIDFSKYHSEEAFFDNDVDWIDGPKLEWP